MDSYAICKGDTKLASAQIFYNKCKIILGTNFCFNHKAIRQFLWWGLIFISYIAAFSQRNIADSNTEPTTDTLTSFYQSELFDFPNVNRIPIYYNRDELSLIESLYSQGKQEECYEKLKFYVKHFGVGNFVSNLPILWKLAQLSEKYGPSGEAVLLYKLIIKHHRQGINVNKLNDNYERLETNKKENYVPLDYYYELVNYRKEIDTLRPPRAVFLSMGDNINSPEEDYGPTISHTDKIFLFTSKRNKHTDMPYNEDIFYSIKTDSSWSKATEFFTINTNYNEGSACLSPDGKFLFFSRCNAPGSFGNCDLYVADLDERKEWVNIRNLGPNVNSSGWDSHPSVNHGGDTLYFSSNRLEGFGMADIYFSVKDKDGNWGKAQNVGPIINTVKSEVSPFYHHKYNVLYFSSDGHPLNFGNFDIYKSYRKNNRWEEPLNIGPLVNGEGSEYYFTIDMLSSNLYYARSSIEDIKNLDLFSFPLPMEAHPEAMVRVTGTIRNGGQKELKGIVSIIDLDRGVEVAPKFIMKDGKYDFSLINKRNYLITIQGDDFYRIEDIFFLEDGREVDYETESIQSMISLKSIEFESSRSDVLPSMYQDLDKIGNFLVDHPAEKLQIFGHADSAGKESENVVLSERRAGSIKDYLVKKFKLNSARISCTGYGSSKPVAIGNDVETRHQNRRVEFALRH